jgi:hypothetical protein
VVTIPACTAVRGGLLHIIDLSACTVIVRLAFAEFRTQGSEKNKRKIFLNGEFSLYSCKKASVLNGHEFLFVHFVLKQPLKLDSKRITVC